MDPDKFEYASITIFVEKTSVKMPCLLLKIREEVLVFFSDLKRWG